ncbi:hypothetical protein Tco_0020794, partial [Tanacetum coccineum]
MANQEQNPPQQEHPFVAAKQVGFNLEDIILNPNNEVSFSTPTGGIYGEVGVNTFRNVIGAHYLPHSSEYVAPSSIDIVRPWFETIRYGEVVPAKGISKRVFFLLGGGRQWRWRTHTLPHSSLQCQQLGTEANQPEEPPFIDHMLAICAADTPVVFKAPKTSSKAESVSQGIKPGAKHGHKKLSTSSKQPSVSSKEATKGGSSKAPTSSKTCHSKKRKEFSSAMDSNPSQPPVSTLVDTRMHKEEQQATGG